MPATALLFALIIVASAQGVHGVNQKLKHCQATTNSRSTCPVNTNPLAPAGALYARSGASCYD
eukprot:2272462-Pyramimonas_sp.AAC.1